MYSGEFCVQFNVGRDDQRNITSLSVENLLSLDRMDLYYICHDWIPPFNIAEDWMEIECLADLIGPGISDIRKENFDIYFPDEVNARLGHSGYYSCIPVVGRNGDKKGGYYYAIVLKQASDYKGLYDSVELNTQNLPVKIMYATRNPKYLQPMVYGSPMPFPIWPEQAIEVFIFTQDSLLRHSREVIDGAKIYQSKHPPDETADRLRVLSEIFAGDIFLYDVLKVNDPDV